MFATVQVPESVESFDGQGQHGEEPADQQTVGMMMSIFRNGWLWGEAGRRVRREALARD
jgi:hypothetical protein